MADKSCPTINVNYYDGLKLNERRELYKLELRCVKKIQCTIASGICKVVTVSDKVTTEDLNIRKFPKQRSINSHFE